MAEGSKGKVYLTTSSINSLFICRDGLIQSPYPLFLLIERLEVSPLLLKKTKKGKPYLSFKPQTLNLRNSTAICLE